VFDHICHFKRHAARKNPCKPTVSEVIPNMSNVRIFKKHNGVAIPVIINVENSPHATVNSTVNVTNNNNTFNIMAFGHEDKSHLTPELLTQLILAHSADNAVLHLVRFVHFNPNMPHNMNVFAPKDTPSRARVFDGTGWKEFNKEDTAMLMAQGLADDLVARIEDNTAKVNVFKADEYNKYCKRQLECDLDLMENAVNTIDAHSYLLIARYNKTD
jgi:hypothetical protein